MDVYKAEVFIKELKPFHNIKIILNVLRYTGSWPSLDSGFSRFLSLTYSFSFFMFTLGMYLSVESINLFLNYNSISKIASGGPLFITNILHAYKVLEVLFKSLFPSSIRFKNIMSWYAWQGIFHHFVIQITGLGATVFWSFIPISFILHGIKRLPLDGWYPYDTTESYGFFLTWAHQAVAIILCCINNLSMDTFIAALINVASCQFEILKWNIAAIGNDIEIQRISSNSKEKADRNFHDKSITEELRSCVEHNLAIFDYVKEIENVFGTVIGFQLIVNSLIICLTVYYLSQLTSFVAVEIIGFVSYTLCMAYQIFIYCWNGNELYLQNDNLATAIYMGNWWKLNSRHKRALHIIMIRTRKSLIMSAIFLIKMIVPTFMSIIQMSYSMFTLLHRKNNSK